MNESTDEHTIVDEEEEPKSPATPTKASEWWAFITECLSFA